ncbi:nuclease (plasmid) [Nostoc sp. HK-01]|nr:nuclease [Nostoc sp. HK-01]
MNSLQKIGTIVAALALTSTAVWIVRSMNNSPAFPEQWAVMEVTDGQTMTVRQTDGSQMQVRLCGAQVSYYAGHW